MIESVENFDMTKTKLGEGIWKIQRARWAGLHCSRERILGCDMCTP